MPVAATHEDPAAVGLTGAALLAGALTQDRTQVASATRPGALDASGVDAQDIPFTALYAYETAAAALKKADPDCGLDWSLLAAIGRVESDHGRYGGAELGEDGVSAPLIRGVALDGRGPVRAIHDTDAGRLDGDRQWDRAVGPMQFLPSTWVYSGVDADGDGVRSPDDLDDAALAAGVYLCSGAGELDTEQGLRAAVLRYNRSTSYVDTVLGLAEAYAAGRYTSVTPYTPVTSASLEPTRIGPANTDLSARLSGPERPGTGPSDGGDDRPGDQPGATDPSPTDPSPTDPSPTDPSPTDPSPTDPSPTDPSPTDPGPGAALVPVTGTLADCAGEASEAPHTVSAFCIQGGAQLFFGDEASLEIAAAADHDGDRTLETNGAEVAGLLGAVVDLMVEEGTAPLVVRSINGVDYVTLSSGG